MIRYLQSHFCIWMFHVPVLQQSAAEFQPVWWFQALSNFLHPNSGQKMMNKLENSGHQLPFGHIWTFLCPSSPGAVRHHRPASSSTKAEQRGSSARAPEVAIDFDAAEALGRKILGKGSWVKRIFEEFDGSVSWHVLAKGWEALRKRREHEGTLIRSYHEVLDL